MSAQVLEFKQKKKIDQNYNDLLDKLSYYNEMLDNYVESIVEHRLHILSGMHSIFGPHSKEKRELFLSFLNNPCIEIWSGIRNLLIDNTTTSWQLWIRHCSDAPLNLQGDNKYKFPTPEKFIQYFNQHKEDRIISLQSIIYETEEELKKYKT